MTMTTKTCSYEDCTRTATTHDCEGDDCCDVHAAQQYDWVLIDRMDGDWITEEHASRIESELADLGITLTIRLPRSGEADNGGFLADNGDGALSSVHGTAAHDAIKRLVDDAHDRTNFTHSIDDAEKLAHEFVSESDNDRLGFERRGETRADADAEQEQYYRDTAHGIVDLHPDHHTADCTRAQWIEAYVSTAMAEREKQR